MHDHLLNIQETHQKIIGLSKPYRFLHITDLHISLSDADASPERIEHAAWRTDYFSIDGLNGMDRFKALRQYIIDHQNELDGIIFTGDIIDAPCKANLEFLENWFAELPVPYIYTLGNHDWTYMDDYQTPHALIADRPKFHRLCDGNSFVHKKQFGEITVVALDDTRSDYDYEDGVAETLAEMLQGETNVFLIQHIPLDTPTLQEDTLRVWKRNLTIGGEGVSKGENWKKIMEQITAEDSPVKGVIAGHLHFWHEDLLGEKVPQYITAFSTQGNARLFIFK